MLVSKHERCSILCSMLPEVLIGDDFNGKEPARLSIVEKERGFWVGGYYVINNMTAYEDTTLNKNGIPILATGRTREAVEQILIEILQETGYITN